MGSTRFNQHNVKMDKQLLCPRLLHIEPAQPDAASMFDFWLRTVENFISTLQELRRDDDRVAKKRIIISDVTAYIYREELTRDFMNELASSAVFQRLLGKEELSLNQAFELADNLDRAHRYSSCMGPLVPDQSLPMMTSESNARKSGAAACTRRSSSSVVKAVSFFFCGLDTHRNRSLCPARNFPCHICGKRGNFAHVSRSEGSSNDVASAAITAPVRSVHRPFLASAPASLGSAVVPGTLNDSPVQVLIDSGTSTKFVDLDVCDRLNLAVCGDRSSIDMASSEMSVESFGKTTADLNLLDPTNPSSNFRVLNNLFTDVIVGQTFCRQNSSFTFVMNGQKEALMMAATSQIPWCRSHSCHCCCFGTSTVT